MNRRTLLGTLVAGVATALAGCGGGGEDTPQGTLVGDSEDGGIDGDGGSSRTPTEPPTTGARDVFEGVDFDVAPADGGTRTSWTIENTSDGRWAVTVVSILEVEPAPDTPTGTGTRTDPETTPTVSVDEESRRITVDSGEQTTEEFLHDVAPDAWSSFRFDFRDLQEV